MNRKAVAVLLRVLSPFLSGCAGDLPVDTGDTVAELSTAECAAAAPWAPYRS